MSLYDGKGNKIVLEQTHLSQVEYNFSSITDAINRNTNITASVSFKSDDVFGDKMYCGGICCNNKIYFCPNTADSIMVYDLINDYYYFIAQKLGDFAFKYTGIVQYDGFLYCIPRGVNNILQINPVTDEVLKIDLDTNYPVQPNGNYLDSHHYNGCISEDGYLYCPPAFSSDKLLKINMNTFKCSELDFTCEHSSTWQGCCNIPNTNNILFIGNKGFRVWDCTTDEIIADVNANTDLGVYDMVYDPRDGNFYGFGSVKFVKFDTSNNTYTQIGWVNYLDNTYGTVLGIDGKFYTVSPTGAVYCVDRENFSAMAVLSSECSTEGMTVCSAGLVLTNDGSIFSVPGNGRLIKVSFSGVTGRLQDYVVSGKYYGKY